MATRQLFSLIAITILHVSDCKHLVKRSDDTDPLQAMVTQQGHLINEMKAEITTMKGRLDNVEKLVAFMVNVPSSQDLVHNPKVNFGNPSLNIGGGFNTGTDTFVAPVSGVYVFFLKVSGGSRSSNNYETFGVIKEGQVIAETETNDDNNVDRASVQVVVQVSAGESVWVKKVGGDADGIHGGGVASTFGGFLVRAGAHA